MAWNFSSRNGDTKIYTCLSTDVKKSADIGSYLYEFNVSTGSRTTYQTYDGTNWVRIDDDTIGSVSIVAGQTVNANLQVGNTNNSATNPAFVSGEKSNTLSNTTTLVTVSATPTLVAAENTNRLQITIQNNGLNPCLIKYGNTLSISDYNVSLSPCSSVRDGRGGGIFDNVWTGAIYAMTESGTTTLSITEIIKQV